MTAKQYADYESSVAAFHERNKLRPGCNSAHHDEDGDTNEPFFSWQPCECCGSHLGGDRETYSFAREDNTQFNADICVDCVYYLAYGVLDDMTMMSIEADRTAQPATPAATEGSV